MDFRAVFAKFFVTDMKNDTTTTLLNFVLAVLVILGVVFAYLTIWRTRDLRGIQQAAVQANSKVMMAQSLINDVNVYNAKARSPEINGMLQAFQPKSAAH